MDYFKRIESEYDFNTLVKNGSFPVDYIALIEDSALKGSWPELKDDFFNEPHQTLNCLSLAMHQVCCIALLRKLRFLTFLWFYKDHNRQG